MRPIALGLACLCCFAGVQSIAQQPAYIGNASCATSTCHGNVIGRGPEWNHSLSTYLAKDPHAGAGILLRDLDSRAIVELLDPKAAESAEAYDNVLRTRCISCHATPTAEQCEPGELVSDQFLAQGVSCEACHGAAEAWLDPHVRVDWTGPQRFQPETGMTDTESILGRAQTCVRCHIGSRTRDGLVRDMNHDIIAAGHPALRFDLLLYNESLPHHWAASSEAEQSFNESAVRVRKVGRAVNLSAAATLSSERAGDHLKDPTVPWPEFADYDCFACHQSLSIDAYRLPGSGDTESSSNVSDGLPIWNAWHTVGQVSWQRRALEALSPHLSDPQRIATQAKTLADRYRDAAAEHVADPIDASAVLLKTLQELQKRAPVDWHQAAIQYLEIDAALRDLTKDDATRERAEQFSRSLPAIERQLRFDANRESGQAANYHSPVRFRREEFRKDFRVGVLRVFGLKPVD